MRQAGTGALVTGAARRIGRAIALDLASHGFVVAVHCDGSREDAEYLCDIINKDAGTARVVQADLTDANATRHLVDNAIEAVGPLRTVVTNATISEDASVPDITCT